MHKVFKSRIPQRTEPQTSDHTNCPYVIQLLYTTSVPSSSIYLIREKDHFGEYPNIYVKVYYKEEQRTPIVLILSDTGTGLNVKNESSHTYENASQSRSPLTTSTSYWNIATFLSHVLNPRHVAPYVVLTTHCHYDHISGIQHLLDADVDLTVLASSNNKDFVTPWRNLQNHSLCEELGLKAPKYDARWIDDGQTITYSSGIFSKIRSQTSITVIHTPGHTPDSVSWYDHDSYTLCVGDMFYEKESDETKSGSGGHWAREPPQPVILNRDSNIIHWNASMHRLLDFVRYENRRLGTDLCEAQYTSKQDGVGHAVAYNEITTCEDDWLAITKVPSRRRVALCASHVTIGTDAEFALMNMLAFMFRVQLDQVPRRRAKDAQGNHDVWLWDDAHPSQDDQNRKLPRAQNSPYSVVAPWSIIHPNM